MSLEIQLMPQPVLVAEQTNITEALKSLRERWEMSAGENIRRVLLTGQLALMDVMEALGIPLEAYDEVLGNTPPTTNPLGPRPLFFIAKY